MRRRLYAFLSLLAALFACAPFALAQATAESVEGMLRGWHGDTSTTPVDAGVGVDTGIAGLVPLTAAPDQVGDLLGRRVRATGTRTGNALRADGGVVPVSGRDPLAALGTKSFAVVLFNFSNDTRQQWTTTQARGVVFDNANSVKAYYLDASYGQLTMTGDVFGWYTIDSSNAGCNYTGWANEARTKAIAAGASLGSYQHVVYAFPYLSSCGWAGLAYLPARRAGSTAISTFASSAWDLRRLRRR